MHWAGFLKKALYDRLQSMFDVNIKPWFKLAAPFPLYTSWVASTVFILLLTKIYFKAVLTSYKCRLLGSSENTAYCQFSLFSYIVYFRYFTVNILSYSKEWL